MAAEIQTPPPFCPLCGIHHEPAPRPRRWLDRFRRH